MTTWSIGEAAAKCGLSQHTLRWYERIGLLANIERGGDGRRRFSEGDLEWLSLLTKLRATGMPVRDMQRYAELVRSGAGEAERIELLKKHREEVRRALASQRECLKLLDSKIGYYADCLAACRKTPCRKTLCRKTSHSKRSTSKHAHHHTRPVDRVRPGPGLHGDERVVRRHRLGRVDRDHPPRPGPGRHLHRHRRHLRRRPQRGAGRPRHRGPPRRGAAGHEVRHRPVRRRPAPDRPRRARLRQDWPASRR